MRWFRVYAELIDDPKFIKLGPELRAARLIDDLRRHGFIDEDEKGLAPHNWASR